MTQAGPAIPVIAVTDRAADAGPALRVAVVSDGRPTEGGPARPVIVVTDGRATQGNEPLPVVVATGAQATHILAGPAIPVVVVSGSLSSGVAPVNTVLPVISGTRAIGSILSTTDGTWTGTAPIVYTYQWKRNGVNIALATNNTYTLVAADAGTTITVTVTATNIVGSASATSAGVAISSLLTSLAAYYKMEEASGTRADATGRGNTLSDNGSTINGAGIILNAAQFSGTSFLSIANNADVAGGDVDMTIAFWIYVPTGGSGFPEVYGVDGTGTDRNYSAFIDMSTNALTVQFYKAGPTAVTRSVTIVRDVWQLITAWHDSVNNLVGIRLNGGADSTVATGGALQANGTSPLRIGRATATGARMPAGSRIDEFGLWRRVLTSGERTSLYNAGAGITYPFS